MEKIGVLGGTFDPIHNGHLSLAKDAMQQTDLEKVIFVPAKLQPFKLGKEVTEPHHRLAMVQEAIKDRREFIVSEYEINSAEISYTCNTLRALQEEMPEARLYFITGTDAFLKICKWKNAQEILQKYSLIVGSRPGYKETELAKCIEKIRKVYNTDIHKIDNHMLDISATEIRERQQQGKEFASLVPPEVERYIRKHGLY